MRSAAKASATILSKELNYKVRKVGRIAIQKLVTFGQHAEIMKNALQILNLIVDNPENRECLLEEKVHIFALEAYKNPTLREVDYLCAAGVIAKLAFEN